MIHVLLGSADFDDRIPDRDNCIFWQDDLSFGPVPSTETLDDLTRIRAAFWDSTHFDFATRGSHETLGTSPLSERDEQLHRLMEADDEVVFWCGPNRREVLMLCAVLRFLQTVSGHKITLVQCPQWGASSCSSEQLARFFNQRSPIPSGLAEFSLELWRVYTNSDPSALSQLTDRLGESHPMQTVVRRMIEEYPSITNGLSRTEEMLLGTTKQPDSILRVIGRTIGNSEDPIGDVQLYEKIREFLIGKTPILEVTGGQARVVERGALEEFRRLIVQPTSLALELLASKADYVAVDGIERWIGGVHLQGHSVAWRFDPATGRLVFTDNLHRR
jgi:Domain of unknown function (DUF1835)